MTHEATPRLPSVDGGLADDGLVRLSRERVEIVDPEGLRWIGLVGLVPLSSALPGYCPAYTFPGIRTCPMKAGH